MSSAETLTEVTRLELQQQECLRQLKEGVYKLTFFNSLHFAHARSNGILLEYDSRVARTLQELEVGYVQRVEATKADFANRIANQ